MGDLPLLEPWQQWATAAIAFLSGLAAIWATLRLTRRKDRVLDARLGLEQRRTEQEQEAHDQENALKQCWAFARNRERWYSEERKMFLAQMKSKDDLTEELREEIHAARAAWSEEQLKRVRLEETVRWLQSQLTERDREEHDPGTPPSHSDPSI